MNCERKNINDHERGLASLARMSHLNKQDQNSHWCIRKHSINIEIYYNAIQNITIQYKNIRLHL